MMTEAMMMMMVMMMMLMVVPTMVLLMIMVAIVVAAGSHITHTHTPRRQGARNERGVIVACGCPRIST